jgi:hypothetical protein
MRSFAAVFVAVIIGVALIVGALLLNNRRPAIEAAQPTPALARATGKCAECHARETPAIVHEYEMSRHAAVGVSCLDCHQPAKDQQKVDHRGFVLASSLTSGNCAQCHATQYQQYLRSRHAAPAWAAVGGPKDFRPEQIAFAEQYHKGAVNRPANPIATLEGPTAISGGCNKCHAVGKPNSDGSIGSCTNCHARHVASVRLARLPETCGQCHMGPDHSQIEIYHESKHGVLFNAQQSSMNLSASPQKLTTRDMPVPTCATCHMSGLEGQHVTHDTTERLSYYLFAPITEKRPTYLQGQNNMKETCGKCHTRPRIDRFYAEGEEVVGNTNRIVTEAKTIMDGLYASGRLTKAQFDEPIEYTYFDLWHYYGRTAKHGAFMGGADFVQWHGNYELAVHLAELKRFAAEGGEAKKPADKLPVAQGGHAR